MASGQPRKRSYLDLKGPIDWLVKARPAWKCHPIDCKPTPPLTGKSSSQQ